MKTIKIGNNKKITLEVCKQIAREGAGIELDKSALPLMEKSNEILFKFQNGRVPVYGLSTQFGDQANLLDSQIESEENEAYWSSLRDRQFKLVVSHDCGLGPETDNDIVRVAMTLRAHCLGKGYSGVRPAVVQSLIGFVNNDIVPRIRRYGSIGASGDLIPLSAVAAALIGAEVDVLHKGERKKAGEAIKESGLEDLRLVGREGLALINGTSFMSAIAGLTFYDLNRLYKQMLSAIAMSLESLLVIDSAYNPLVHELKGHQGEIEVNNFLNEFWKGSKLVCGLGATRKKALLSWGKQRKEKRRNLDEEAKRVQDYYSIRSVAQGFGTFHENLAKTTQWVETEINSVNDNPITDHKSNEIHHNSNFMGYYITDACDTMKNEISTASTWIHAVLANLVHPRKNYGLPANLVNAPDIENAFRPLQLLAAALAVENRKLAQNHQSFMIPTEGDNQDVNSLGTHAAFDLKESVANLERLTAILMMASAQALELRGIEKASLRSQEIHTKIRKFSSFVREDRLYAEDIGRIEEEMKVGNI